jgi:hypothetical protein
VRRALELAIAPEAHFMARTDLHVMCGCGGMSVGWGVRLCGAATIIAADSVGAKVVGRAVSSAE